MNTATIRNALEILAPQRTPAIARLFEKIENSDSTWEFEYGMSPVSDVLLDCHNAAEQAAADIKERSLLSRARGRGIRKGLLRHYLPGGLRKDPKAIKAGLVLLDDLLNSQ